MPTTTDLAPAVTAALATLAAECRHVAAAIDWYDAEWVNEKGYESEERKEAIEDAEEAPRDALLAAAAAAEDGDVRAALQGVEAASRAERELGDDPDTRHLGDLSAKVAEALAEACAAEATEDAAGLRRECGSEGEDLALMAEEAAEAWECARDEAPGGYWWKEAARLWADYDRSACSVNQRAADSIKLGV